MSKKSRTTKPVPEKKSAPKESAPIEVSNIADAPMLGTSEPVLGTLSSKAEQKVDAPAESPKRSFKKKTRAEHTETPPLTDAPPPTDTPPPTSVPTVLSAEAEPEAEPLKLPRGGFIAFRKSGGLNFSTREVVVYPDGRVAYDARGVPQKEYNRLRRVLNDGQIIALRKLLDQTNFWKAETSGTQNPDAFAYEIAARIGQRSNELEVFDGSVPENLKPLIQQLTKLLPA